ncbi:MULTISPECIES: sugar ABC transporter ATP-binding protein [unclassified Nocardioides]|uniref:sugar ABC transporter ATP-binding protein n=1 Tax=unclassified Nocardioides TaxID=2615069 RepID=UPI001F619B93|nr:MULTISPECIES: sugar ABC transporter ATP-binding protein [unclassified Nocardioides]
MGDATGPPLLELRGVQKSFGPTRALKDANLSIPAPGVVHALIGENGSGKSTLLGVLSGQTRHDAGTVRIEGHSVRFGSPVAALRHGIAMVSQEVAVAPDLSVAENVLLGRGLVRGRTGVSRSASRAKAHEVLERLDFDIDPDVRVRRLRPDQRQMVEIARALTADAKVLILDEPTSSLTDDEVQALFATVRRLKAQGVAIIFVSHRMQELFEIADDITVLRDGVTVAQGGAGSFTPESLVDAMLGQAPPVDQANRPEPASAPTAADPVALRVDALTVAGLVEDFDVTLRRGEIVGLAGLVGAGRSEVLEAIFGARAFDAGSLAVDGTPYLPRGPRRAIQQGLAFVPADRKTDGLVLAMTGVTNMTMVETHDAPRLTPPARRRGAAAVARLCTALRIAPGAVDVPTARLSGGNQQKVAVAKWLVRRPKVLLLDEPTRGVDVMAKADIHHELRATAAAGTALLVSSSEISELLSLCDRVLVMFRGRVVADVAAADTHESEILKLAGGHPS